MITVTIETGTYEGGFERAWEAECEPEAAIFTARIGWDEAYTGIQGCRRRIIFSGPDGDIVRVLGERP